MLCVYHVPDNILGASATEIVEVHVVLVECCKYVVLGKIHLRRQVLRDKEE